MQMSSDINKLAEALSKAQGEMKPAKKNSSNPFHKSSYADLDDCWSALRDPLSHNGLSVMQLMEERNGQQLLVTVLSHMSGQWVRSETPILAKESSSQAFGSACSYARRYGLCSITGLTSSDDDDGEAAEGRRGVSHAQEERRAPPQGTIKASPAQAKFLGDLLKMLSKEDYEVVCKKHSFESLENLTAAKANEMIKELKP